MSESRERERPAFLPLFHDFANAKGFRHEADVKERERGRDFKREIAFPNYRTGSFSRAFYTSRLRQQRWDELFARIVIV